MECHDVAAQLADYLAGTLTDAELDAIRAHLTGCAACRDDIDAYDDSWQLLGAIPAERADSTAMRARFDAALGGYAVGRDRDLSAEAVAKAEAAPARTAGWRGRVAIPPYWQAAAAAALLVTGIGLGRNISPAAAPAAAPADGQAAAQLVALRSELGEMRQMVTLSLLQQQSASERLRGVTFTNQIPQPGSEVVTALLDALTHDQNVNVRLASIDALRRFADRDLVRRSTLAAFDQQTSPLVQIALIDFVLEAAGPDAAATLRQLSADTMLDRAVRARAAAGLERLGVKS
jgi:hypothetical protein